MTYNNTATASARTASAVGYGNTGYSGTVVHDSMAGQVRLEEKSGKASAVAKLVACAASAILLALMAPVLAEGLNPGELISAAGFPSAIGAIIADGAVLLLMAMAGVALLGAVRALGLAFELAVDLSALGSPLLASVSQKLGFFVSGFVGVAAMFAGINGLFNLMVEHGLNAALSATHFLAFAAVCAVALIVFWLFMAFSSRSFGVALSFAQYVIRSGGLGAMVVLFLSIALAPILILLVIGAIGLAIGVAMAAAGVVIFIALLPFIIQICILACRD